MLGGGVLVAGGVEAQAAPPVPVVLNFGAQNGVNAQWMETQQLASSGEERTFFATFLVQHAPGRRIFGVKLDADFNGTDDTGGAAMRSVAAQTYVGTAGGIETSRVSVGFDVGTPSGFSCTFAGGTRVVDGPVRMRVVDSTGEQSGSLSTTVRFVEDTNCAGIQDYPRLTSAAQSGAEAVPGQELHYTFTCDDVDPDLFSSDDDCDRANVRWRRLGDGGTSAPQLVTDLDDTTAHTVSMSFPARGYYVVEARFGNENGGFPQTHNPTGGWWRLGNAEVNDASTGLSGSCSPAPRPAPRRRSTPVRPPARSPPPATPTPARSR
ncbi:MAG: hypothetical protein ACRDT4_00985 [Micromonosporaceae bacterium]